MSYLYFRIRFNMDEIKEVINQKLDIYQHLIDFIDKEDANDTDFQLLIKYLNLQKIRESKEELSQFLYMISKISKNNRRLSEFDEKIQKIIFNFSIEIKQVFTNAEIFNFFQSNKPFLLYLIKSGIITVTEEISNILYTQNPHFFYPEIKPFLPNEVKSNIEKVISKYMSNFENLRQTGENPSKICTLIRNDSIEEFVSYLNKTNLSISSKIKLNFHQICGCIRFMEKVTK